MSQFLTYGNGTHRGGDAGTLGVRVIAEYPPVELVELRDDHTRVYEIVRELETTHPDGSKSVETVKSHIHEKGSGLCYRDQRGNFVPSVAEWRETPDGFVIDRCAYGLSMGKTIASGLGYGVDGHELILRPAYLMISDGVNEANLAVLNPEAAGFIVAESPSALRFPAAFGPGYDLEYVAEKGGFHQNLIIAQPPDLPAGFDLSETCIYLFTEMSLDSYLAASGLEVLVEGQPLDTAPPDLLSPPSHGGCISFYRSGRILHAFSISRVTDSSRPGALDRQTMAEKRLMKDPSAGAAYLVECVPLCYLADPALCYPVVWDYEKITGPINQPSTWERGTTYLVSSNLNVSDHLTIEAGAFIKLNKNTIIFVLGSSGKVTVEENGADYARFTESGDNDPEWGEKIKAGDADPGRYTCALQLCEGSSEESEINCCMFRKGGMAVWVMNALKKPIRHNIISDMPQGIGVCFFSCGTGGGCDSNLMAGCQLAGIVLSSAGTVPTIRNNTIDGSQWGVYAYNSSCPEVKENILSNCQTGIYGPNDSSLTLSNNGFWRCGTNVSGPDAGSDNVYLDDSDDPYVGDREFFLSQSCNFVDAGLRSAAGAGLGGHTTSHAIEEPDLDEVDLGFHYPIVLRPYLQNVKTDRITVMWHSKMNATGYVQWGSDANYGQQSFDSSPDHLGNLYIYEVDLVGGLQAGADYHYRATVGSLYSPDGAFRTPKSVAEDFWFAAYGDNRGVGAQSFREEHQRVANAILNHGWFRSERTPRFALHVGDFVNTGGNVPEWRPDFFDPASRLLAWTPLFPSIGNHELGGTEGLDKYRRFFCVDTGTPGYQERWYSLYYADCKIICLDSNLTGADRQAQQNWLEGELDDTTNTWKFVLLHHPAFSDATALPEPPTRTAHDGTANGGHPYEEQPEMYYALHTLAPMFRQHGVDIVFCGHNHFYERSGDDTDQTAGIGPTYIMTGGGGAPGGDHLHHGPDFGTNDNPKRQYAEAVFHHVTVDVMSNKLLIKALRNDGSVLDFDARDTADHFLHKNNASTMAKISTGATWRYYQDGYPGDGWMSFSFDDGGWPSGPTRIGFGHPDKERTTIDQNHRNEMTYFFRKKFNAYVDLSTVDFAFLEVLHDDGCVVYLNGTEVFRSNLPAPSSHATAATNSVSLPYEDNFVRCMINKSLLQAQNNILAAGVHRVSLTDDDMAFDLRLKYFAEDWW